MVRSRSSLPSVRQLVVQEQVKIDIELGPKVEEAPPEPTTPSSRTAADTFTDGVAAHSDIPCPPPPEPTTPEHLAGCLAADESFPIDLGSRSPMPFPYPDAECAFQARHVRCPFLHDSPTNLSVADCGTNLYGGGGDRGDWRGAHRERREGQHAGLRRCPIAPYFLVGLWNLSAGICSNNRCESQQVEV